MAYVSATELTLIFPANVSIGTNTLPIALGEVASIIAETQSRFDAVAAGAGYAVPIATGASSYPMVQQIVKDGAGGRVLRILFPRGEMRTAEDWTAAYEAALKAIMDSDLLLLGAAEDASETNRLLPRAFSTANISDDPVMTGASAYISRVWEP
jgi:hypothetical protein